MPRRNVLGCFRLGGKARAPSGSLVGGGPGNRFQAMFQQRLLWLTARQELVTDCKVVSGDRRLAYQRKMSKTLTIMAMHRDNHLGGMDFLQGAAILRSYCFSAGAP